jgi:hypothetical protein
VWENFSKTTKKQKTFMGLTESQIWSLSRHRQLPNGFWKTTVIISGYEFDVIRHCGWSGVFIYNSLAQETVCHVMSKKDNYWKTNKGTY